MIKTQSKIPLYVGIDPGLSGAVAVINALGEVISIQDTPTLERRVGKSTRREYAEPAMATLLEAIAQSGPVLVALENVHSMPKQGVASSFSFGVGFGVWRGILAALRLPHERVEPTVWKRALKLPSSKGAAVAKALRLFPRAELGHTWRGRMIYADGRAEALLLAAYARERLGAQNRAAAPK